jgi:hypothetical protein
VYEFVLLALLPTMPPEMEVQLLAAQLGDANFGLREGVTVALARHPHPAAAQAARAALNSDDPEVVRRAGDVLQAKAMQRRLRAERILAERFPDAEMPMLDAWWYNTTTRGYEYESQRWDFQLWQAWLRPYIAEANQAVQFLEYREVPRRPRRNAGYDGFGNLRLATKNWLRDLLMAGVPPEWLELAVIEMRRRDNFWYASSPFADDLYHDPAIASWNGTPLAYVQGTLRMLEDLTDWWPQLGSIMLAPVPGLPQLPEPIPPPTPMPMEPGGP